MAVAAVAAVVAVVAVVAVMAVMAVMAIVTERLFSEKGTWYPVRLLRLRPLEQTWENP